MTSSGAEKPGSKLSPLMQPYLPLALLRPVRWKLTGRELTTASNQLKNVASVTNVRLLLVKTKHLEQIYYSWFYKPPPSYQNLGKAIKRLVFGKFDLIILKALASWAEVVVECLRSERTQFESRHRQRALLLWIFLSAALLQAMDTGLFLSFTFSL